MKTIWINAGELSGDMQAAALLKLAVGAAEKQGVIRRARKAGRVGQGAALRAVDDGHDRSALGAFGEFAGQLRGQLLGEQVGERHPGRHPMTDRKSVV